MGPCIWKRFSYFLVIKSSNQFFLNRIQKKISAIVIYMQYIFGAKIDVDRLRDYYGDILTLCPNEFTKN